MSKDIVQEALDNAKAMREAALENAKTTLVDAMATNLKSVVSEAITEQLSEEKDIPSDYHTGKKGQLGDDRMGDEIPAKGDTGDDLTGEGDGPAIIEAGIEEEEEEEMATDMEESEDMEDMDEEEDMEEGSYEEEDEDDMEEGSYEEEDEEMDMDDDDDLDSDDDDDMEEVIEITEEDDDDDEMEEGEDEEEVTAEEIVGEMVKLDRENKQLRKENARLSKAVKILNNRIDEVNLFNARLAATSELMRKVTLTKEEKERAIKILDTASSINEVKRSYKALYEGYRAGGRQVKSKNRVNRRPVHSVMTESAKKTETLNEGVVDVDRLARLAGIQ